MILELLPEIVVGLGALLVLATYPRWRLSKYLSFAILSISFLSLLLFSKPQSLFNDAFVIDAFSTFFKILFLGISLLLVLSTTQKKVEFYSLLLFATLGMMIVASSKNLILLFIAFELSSMSTFAMVGLSKDKKAAEAALKFFLIGAISSTLTLYGFTLIYSSLKTFYIPAILDMKLTTISSFGTIFVVAGFGFKMGVVPFHMWLPDTYQGAETSVTALLASSSKKMGFAATFRVLVALMLLKDLTFVFVVLSVLTMTLGNVTALSQKNVKRMLAYSSIGHAGYILVGLAVLTPLGIAASMLHILAHAIMTFGAFIVVSIMESNGMKSYEDYAGLTRKAPLVAISMTIFLLSLTGIPPLIGFWGKFFLIVAALQKNMIFLAMILILN
ncbi:MAG: NADH-quinone oxidoreductase subunit N, partial [Candidatus Methanofastidiosia archaeon]